MKMYFVQACVDWILAKIAKTGLRMGDPNIL
jgi:hypothetical protein